MVTAVVTIVVQRQAQLIVLLLHIVVQQLVPANHLLQVVRHLVQAIDKHCVIKMDLPFGRSIFCVIKFKKWDRGGCG